MEIDFLQTVGLLFRLVRMACTAALLAALGLVTLLLSGQAAPPTPRQRTDLHFMGSEVDYNVQVRIWIVTLLWARNQLGILFCRTPDDFILLWHH